MKSVGMAWIRLLGFGLLLGLSGGALGQALPRPPPIPDGRPPDSRPLDGRPPETRPLEPRPPHGPRPPAQQRTLTLQQLRALVERAAQIVPELRSGEPVRRSQPGSQRPAVPLSYQGAVVAFAYLTPQGNLADLASALPTADGNLPQAAPELPAQLARLGVSGLVRLSGPHARVSLILDGRAVAELNFDRQGRLVPVRADKPAPPGKPVPGGKPLPGGQKEPGKKGP